MWPRKLFSKTEERELRAAERRVLKEAPPKQEKVWRSPTGLVMGCIICNSNLTLDGRYCRAHSE